MELQIEKIRKEIERLKEYAKSSKKEWESEGYNQNAFAEDCRISSFNKLLAFLDSLQEETHKESLHIPETCKEKSKSFTYTFDVPDNDGFLVFTPMDNQTIRKVLKLKKDEGVTLTIRKGNDILVG